MQTPSASAITISRLCSEIINNIISCQQMLGCDIWAQGTEISMYAMSTFTPLSVYDRLCITVVYSKYHKYRKMCKGMVINFLSFSKIHVKTIMTILSIWGGEVSEEIICSLRTVCVPYCFKLCV